MLNVLVAALDIFLVCDHLSITGNIGGPSLFGGGGNNGAVTGGFTKNFGNFQQKNANDLSR